MASRRFTPSSGTVRATKAALAVGAVALTLGGFGALAASDRPTSAAEAAPPATAIEQPAAPPSGRRGRGDLARPGSPHTPPTTSRAPAPPSDGSIQAPAPNAPPPAARSRSSR
ncbi:MAG: hypothetical protein U0556_11465 [Dehalococcoidia bacterium]